MVTLNSILAIILCYFTKFGCIAAMYVYGRSVAKEFSFWQFMIFSDILTDC